MSQSLQIELFWSFRSPWSYSEIDLQSERKLERLEAVFTANKAAHTGAGLEARKH